MSWNRNGAAQHPPGYGGIQPGPPFRPRHSSLWAGRRWIAIRVHHAVDPIDVAGESNVVHKLAVESGFQRVVRDQRLASTAPDQGAQTRELPCTILLDDKGAATVSTPQTALPRQACRRSIGSIAALKPTSSDRSA